LRLSPRISGIVVFSVIKNAHGSERGVWFEKFDNKNVIKLEKGDTLDFLTTPSKPLKRIWPKPQRLSTLYF
jgi:hypothetical protein